MNDDARWRTAGDRIQTLLDASAAGGPVARERAEHLVREVVDLYGAALARVLELVAEHDPAAVERCATDDLVASLLLVHGLHPHDVHRRVADALDSVRPYLGSHGGDIELLEITGETARLRFSGSCKSCPSSAVTLELTVEDAVRCAAPEITEIEVVAAEPSPVSTVIPAESLLSRVRAEGHAGASWHPVPDLADLHSGEVGGFMVAGTTVLACRIDDELFAYHDRCGSCEASLAGTALHRRMGAAISGPVLRCPRCRAHFDVVHAGAGIDADAGPEVHLDPIPLLVRDGVLSIAVQPTPSAVL
ncbi:NifU family protein [Mycolicibacterium sp. P1-5]|uniref:NifU family protein n=1 Tax=Mycolicibacterium sp. P1-5 TaxID=2024617 RepID=UPI001D140544|nr:NifU family protein [Mycolicibacterium sp. P1-5]